MRAADFDFGVFRSTAEEIAMTSGAIVARAIRAETAEIVALLEKPDKTFVTKIDRDSQAAGQPIIIGAFPNAHYNFEEKGGAIGNKDSEIQAQFDPLDGTRGGLGGGATPTVLFGAYDKVRKLYIASMTYEPSTGRFWISGEGQGAHVRRYSDELGKWTTSYRQVSVNKQDIRANGQVLVDVTHPFPQENPTFRQAGRRELTTMIENIGSKEGSYHSGGGHYARIAAGYPNNVGLVQSALGGPWDMQGINAVIEAGGFARVQTIEEIGGVRRLIELENHDNERAKIVIAANNEANYRELRNMVIRCVEDF